MTALHASDDGLNDVIVAVLLPLRLSEPYHYSVAAGLALAPGDVVRVPFGKRREIGVVWDWEKSPPEGVALKTVGERLSVPPLATDQRRFVDWVAAYTLTPPGMVLKMVLAVPEACDNPRGVPRLGPSSNPRPAKITAGRARVLDAATTAPGTAGELAERAGVGVGVVRALLAADLLETLPPEPDSMSRPDPARPGPTLSPVQSAAAATLCAAVAEQAFSATLLEGVTGSGKTEVYFEAIAEALRSGRQALVLLPEIALSAQWLARFEARFGARPVVWHSEIGMAEKRRAWRAIAEGRATVVVGARSALFLPFPTLGLIVVDEEHDSSYKQEDGVLYNARDMAVVRARLAACPVVLASATPSLETLTNVREGRYRALHLPERHGGAELPTIEIVDMRMSPPPRGEWIAPALRAAVAETLAGGEQALLFLNRRGYAPLTLCRTCGHRLQCPNCSTWLVEHRSTGAHHCHHCGHRVALPSACPACGGVHWAACGPGVERVAEEAARLFPDARVALAASDTLTTAKAAEAFVARILERKVDIIVGTQVVAKGHHFPALTLIGVIDADLGLSGGDLRAGERTFQVLSQVAGRAGREQRPGRVFLQTYEPDQPVIRALASGDREAFLAAETRAREAARMPPFARLAAVILSGPDEAKVERGARALAAKAPREPGLTVLGPAPAPLALLRGRHRRRFLVRAERTLHLQAILRRWLEGVRVPSAVDVRVDLDPISFL
ncbi:MAG TPA: primosomal protein N' [Alphaproteobacteria bacterium]|nr:primosomal protein N' [Alphaproteobacteria bacterium]